MTAFDIYSAVGGVGEDILEESEIMPKKKNTKIIPLMTAAACFAVFAVGISHALRNDGIEKPVTELMETSPEVGSSETESLQPQTGTAENETGTSAVTERTVICFTDPNDPTETTEMSAETSPAVAEGITVAPTDTAIDDEVEEEEVALVPKWEELSDLDRYVYLDYAGNDYGITMEKFDKSELTFLRNGEIYGIDEYTDKKYSMECAVYKIKNVSSEYMVAVPTADGLYTGFKRNSFWYDTLGEAIEGTGILKRNIIGDTASISDDNARQTTVYTVPDLQQAAERLLNSAPDTDVHVNPPNDRGLVSYRIYGKNGNTVLTVYATGYVSFGVSFFDLGADRAAEFIDHIKQNAADIEIIPYDEPDPNEPVIPE